MNMSIADIALAAAVMYFYVTACIMLILQLSVAIVVAELQYVCEDTVNCWLVTCPVYQLPLYSTYRLTRYWVSLAGLALTFGKVGRLPRASGPRRPPSFKKGPQDVFATKFIC